MGDFLLTLSYILYGYTHIKIKDISTNLYNNLFCRIFTYFSVSGGLISSINLVAVTFDRFISIAYPMKSKLWSSLKICNRVILTICLLAFCISIYPPAVRIMSKRLSYDRIECNAIKDWQNFSQYYTLFIAVLYSFLPSAVLSVLNVLIIIRLKNYNKNKNIVRKNSLNQNMKIITSRLTKMNLVLSISFVLLTLPICLCNIYFFFFANIRNLKPIEKIFLNISLLISFFNHLINLFAYCLCGKLFRNELIHLCKCKKQHIF